MYGHILLAWPHFPCVTTIHSNTADVKQLLWVNMEPVIQWFIVGFRHIALWTQSS